MSKRLAELAANRLDAGARLLRRYADGPATADRTLVLGGVRSGKSRHAELLLADRRDVVYVATGVPATAGDPEWAARVAALQADRPPTWRTVETADLASSLREAEGPLLVDCLGTWVSRVLDDVGAWDRRRGWEHRLDERLTDFLDAWAQVTVPVVAVSNEVGSGVVPGTASGRVFRDVLGALNTSVAAGSESVLLVVAGRTLALN
ncbi:adenosylcobinamide kinase/adenosylcobinamide phosphate guanyltransferase [Amycolatopsis antarctica]|uniref:Adenosylcobinamide kinase n=1 Tax=Amycolatopsis antarctica TaxID=1854586 RepID=A0A263D0A3_9PSEU|nr:bifunctional adenosylcobinamide kinase/adenosylcobinamide-phosphate guanylyltransferase [Amycolatopsis antarctica]OZM71863.1 adenosylcobinamide kinase/adenosylcobinamide phosphate guanyltransferase [Amycolatopsis antarctica]